MRKSGFEPTDAILGREEKIFNYKQNGNKKWHSTETSLIHTTGAILSDQEQQESNHHGIAGH